MTHNECIDHPVHSPPKGVFRKTSIRNYLCCPIEVFDENFNNRLHKWVTLMTTPDTIQIFRVKIKSFNRTDDLNEFHSIKIQLYLV